MTIIVRQFDQQSELNHREKQTNKQVESTLTHQLVCGALLFVNRVAMIAGGEGRPLVLRHP